MSFTKNIYKMLAGLLIIATVANANAGNLCRDELAQTGRSATASKLLTQPVKKVLDRIVGRVEITPSKKAGVLSARVDGKMDNVTRKKAGDGTALIEMLRTHIDDNSPTAVRVEEKAVISEAHFSEFMRNTKTQAFAANFNDNRQIDWAMRDNPPPGHEFLTVTEYGQHFVLKLKSERGKSSVVIKPRFRKYFSYESARRGDLSSYKNSLGDLVALELKIAGLEGPSDGQFLEIPGVVFKPRIFVNNAIADKIKELSPRDEQFEVKLAEIREAILQLKSKKDGSALNREDQVDSMMTAMRWLLAKDEGFFQPQYITTYNRTSYKFESRAGEYQLTVDRNVGVYPANPGAKTDQTIEYLANPPMFKSNEGEVFVELKTPQAEKQSQSSLYQALISGIEAHHIENYKKGSGKYSIARRVEEGMFDSHLITTLLEQGTQFWLLKGTANLDSAPKEKDVINKGEVQVAYPFTVESGKTYRVMFEYRPLNNLNGTMDAILDKIRILDEYGSEIKSKDQFEDIIRDSYRRGENEILGLDFDGTVVPFKSRITHAELVEYRKFLTDFFKTSSRRLETLSDLNTSSQLHWRRVKIKSANFKNWVGERTRRGIFGIFFATVGSLGTVAVYNNHPAIDTRAPIVNSQGQAAPIVTKAVGDIAVLPQLESLVDAKGSPVPLIASPTRDGGYVFVLPKELNNLVQGKTTLQLFGENKQSVEFKVQAMANGNTYLTLK